jgi:hypothetical protein
VTSERSCPVRALESLGLSLTEALAAGQRKDGGLTPAQLAWVLSRITIGDEAPLPGGVAPADLRDYLRGLVDRLARLALPQTPLLSCLHPPFTPPGR